MLRSRRVPEAGSRIDSLVVRAGRIVALIREDRRWRGRWVVVHRGARRGEATATLPFPIARAVLSPDGTRLAVTRPHRLHPALIDLAKGTAEKTPLCVTQAWPHDTGEDRDEAELVRGDRAPAPLGFVTDQRVACRVLNQLS